MAVDSLARTWSQKSQQPQYADWLDYSQLTALASTTRDSRVLPKLGELDTLDEGEF
jgi:hypothetical protein